MRRARGGETTQKTPASTPPPPSLPVASASGTSSSNSSNSSGTSSSSSSSSSDLSHSSSAPHPMAALPDAVSQEVISQCTFTNPETIYKELVRNPRKDRLERWASERKTTPGKYAATAAVYVGNKVANHPYMVTVVWAVFLLTGIFYKWGLAQSRADGGNGNASNVFMHAVIDALVTLAFGALAIAAYTVLWRKARGPKRPDPTPFKNYIELLREVPVSLEVHEDQWLKRAVTNPKKPLHKLSDAERAASEQEWISAQRLQREDNDVELEAFNGWLREATPEVRNQAFESWYRKVEKKECRQFLSFHTGMISWLANGGNQATEGEHGIRPLLKEIGYLVANLARNFPFHFEDVRDAVLSTTEQLVPSPQPASLSSASTKQATESSEQQRKKQASIARAKRASLGGMHAAGHHGMSAREHYGTNANLLNAVTPSPSNGGEGGAGDDDAPSTPALNTATSETHSLLTPGTDDIYNWQLIDAADGFYAATKEARQRAQQSGQTHPSPPASKPVSRDDVILHVMNYLHRVIRDPQGLLLGEGKKHKKINNVRRFLESFLSDPAESSPDELASHCLLLETFLRSVMQEKEWKSWRYFLVHDEIVTEAFKGLPIQKRVWMIYTLMSANDAGKLLALSILQDPRMPLRRLGPAENRSRMTVIRDGLSNNSLTHFFLTYIRTFGGDVEKRLEFCQQLCFLTNDPSGRLSHLFSRGNFTSAFVGAQILRSFTVALPPETYLVRQFTEQDDSRADGASVSSFSELKPARELWPVHAQRLFWSMTDAEAQARVVNEMEYGNEAAGTIGVLGSSKALFSVESAVSREIIRAGVLKLQSMEGLRSLLISRHQSKRERGYVVLAMLLKDRGPKGTEYQEAFQKFVKQYYDIVSTEERTREFLTWLEDNSSIEDSEKETIRCRYVAALISVEEASYHKQPEPRAEKVLSLLRLISPELNLLYLFNAIAFCFYPSENKRNAIREALDNIRSREEHLRSNNLPFDQDRELAALQAALKNVLREGKVAWRARRRIFDLVFLHRRNLYAQVPNNQVNFLDNVLLGTGLIADIVNLMSGNIRDDSMALERVRSVGDLLSSIIEKTYGDHEALVQEHEKPDDERNQNKFEALRDRDLLWQLQVQIGNTSLNRDARFNLTVTALSALKHMMCASACRDIWRVLDGFRIGRNTRDDLSGANYFAAFNESFRQLGIRTHENGPILTLESLYIDMSLYFLGQAEAAYDEEEEVARIEPLHKQAWDRLICVMSLSEVHEKIGPYERRQIAEILLRLVNPFGNQDMRYGQDVNRDRLVHKTLALFLRDLTGVNTKHAAAKLREMFELIGQAVPRDNRDSIVSGVETVLASFRGSVLPSSRGPASSSFRGSALPSSRGLTTGSRDSNSWIPRSEPRNDEASAREKIMSRLLALALYSEFQRMPSWTSQLWSYLPGTSQAVMRGEVVNNLNRMLEANRNDNALERAFEDLGIAPVHDQIRAAIRTHAARHDPVPEDRRALLGGGGDVAVNGGGAAFHHSRL